MHSFSVVYKSVVATMDTYIQEIF